MASQRFFKGLVLVAMVAALAGCAKAPDAELQAAQSALDAAKAAGAETYAPESLSRAEDTLAQAQAEIDAQNDKFALFRSYQRATELLAQAKTEAEQAQADAEAGKEQARREAQGALEQARTALDSATAALETAPRGKGAGADIEAMRADLEALTQSLAEAEAAFAAEDYLNAKSKAEEVQQQAAAIEADIAQAKARTGRR